MNCKQCGKYIDWFSIFSEFSEFCSEFCSDTCQDDYFDKNYKSKFEKLLNKLSKDEKDILYEMFNCYDIYENKIDKIILNWIDKND